jgi:hypothetical protein
MVAQNALVVLDPEQDEAAIAAVLEAHVTLTRATPGGAWIMRMLRAVPQLAPIRIASHRAVARALAERVLALDPGRTRSLPRRGRGFAWIWDMPRSN